MIKRLTALFTALLFLNALIPTPVHSALQSNSLNNTVSAALVCSGKPWIDVRCYGALGDDSHDDTSAFNSWIADLVANNVAGHISAGTYKVTSGLVWDYAGIAGSGLHIIANGNPVIDGVTIAAGPVLQIKASGGSGGSPTQANNLEIRGQLTINASTPAYAFVLGLTNFADEHISPKIDNLIVSNASNSGSAGGCQINFVAIDAELGLFCTVAGGSATVAALAIEQAKGGRLHGSGQAGGASAASLLIENGTTVALNTGGFDYGASATGLSISSVNATRNIFFTPNFSGNATAIIAPQANGRNVIIEPTYGNAAPGTNTGGIEIIGRGTFGRYAAPIGSTYAASGSDDGLILSSVNTTGGAATTVTLPNPATVGAGWSMMFVTDGGKTFILNTSVGNMLAGGRQLSTLTIGPGDFEYLWLRSNGQNFIVGGSPGAMTYIGGYQPGGLWEFPVSNYSTTEGDNNAWISSSLAGGPISVALPTIASIRSGWRLGLAAEGQPITITSLGAHLSRPGGQGNTNSYTLTPGQTALLNFDGTTYHFAIAPPLWGFNNLSDVTSAVTSLNNINGLPHIANHAALRALTGGAYTRVVVDGYGAVGDGGWAIYYWNGASSATDDDGSVIAPNVGSGRWLADFPANVADARVWGNFASVVDVGAPIVAASKWACTTHGKLRIPAATYTLGSTWTIGDGNSTTASTQNGCDIEGVLPGWTETTAPGLNNSPAKFVWNGSAGIPMVKELGPMIGLNLRALALDGANINTYRGLQLLYIGRSHFANILVERMAGGACFELTAAYPNHPVVANGSQDNVFDQLACESPTSGGGAGALILGNAQYGNTDVSQNIFNQPFFGYDASQAGAGIGVLLQFEDNNIITGGRIQPLNNPSPSVTYGSAVQITPAKTADITASIAAGIMNVTVVGAGQILKINDRVTCSGCDPQTYISSFGTGSGNTGTYVTSVNQTLSSRAMTTTDTVFPGETRFRGTSFPGVATPVAFDPLAWKGDGAVFANGRTPGMSFLDYQIGDTEPLPGLSVIIGAASDGGTGCSGGPCVALTTGSNYGLAVGNVLHFARVIGIAGLTTGNATVLALSGKSTFSVNVPWNGGNAFAFNPFATYRLPTIPPGALWGLTSSGMTFGTTNDVSSTYGSSGGSLTLGDSGGGTHTYSIGTACNQSYSGSYSFACDLVANQEQQMTKLCFGLGSSLVVAGATVTATLFSQGVATPLSISLTAGQNLKCDAVDTAILPQGSTFAVTVTGTGGASNWGSTANFTLSSEPTLYPQ